TASASYESQSCSSVPTTPLQNCANTTICTDDNARSMQQPPPDAASIANPVYTDFSRSKQLLQTTSPIKEEEDDEQLCNDPNDTLFLRHHEKSIAPTDRQKRNIDLNLQLQARCPRSVSMEEFNQSRAACVSQRNSVPAGINRRLNSRECLASS